MNRESTRTIVSPWLLAALSLLLVQRQVLAALPPPVADPAPNPDNAASSGTPTPGKSPESGNPGAILTEWSIPPIRLGGTLGYEIRRDSSAEQQNMQKGLTATVNAKTGSFIWQPWFAQWAASLGITASRESSKRSDSDVGGAIRSSSLILAGNSQLAILPTSRFPFEAHFEKSDSRLSSEHLTFNDYSSQRLGFTQHYMRPEGDAMFGWDRNKQNSDSSGTDKQDAVQISAGETLDRHRMQLSANYSRNVHEITSETATQHNVTLQHTYTPVSALSLDNMLNLGRSAYHLAQGDNDTRMAQLSSVAFWRPEDRPLIVTGGVRLLGVNLDNGAVAGTVPGASGSPAAARLRNMNANAGLSYDLDKFTRLNATVNANQTDNNGTRLTNGTQSVGVNYQPDSIALGNFRYRWTASGTLMNRTGGQDSGHQVMTQLSHNLTRGIRFDGGSSINVEMSQAIFSVKSSAVINNENASTAQLTHSGAIGWESSDEKGTALVRLSASDSRAISGRKQSFQMVNLQASSNMPIGAFSYWSGNLTIQAVRQDTEIIVTDLDPIVARQLTDQNKGFVTTSTGQLGYQHQRVFGVRGLRFASDLRLNSQALLPLLGGPKDQETAAWENRLDFTIGRLQLRLSALISRSSSQRHSIDSANNQDKVENNQRMSRAVMFTVVRSFGDF